MMESSRLLGRRLRRRRLIAGIPCLLFSPLVLAQPSDSVRKVGVLIGSPIQPSGRIYFDAFRDGLSTLGWNEGRNVMVEPYWGQGSSTIMKTLAGELLRSRPDVIAVQSATALRAVSQITTDIPIVFFIVSDPVGNRFVKSLSRPGGNVTGFSLFSYEIVGKWLQLLKEIAPNIERVMLLINVKNPNWPGWLSASEPLFHAAGIQLVHPNVTASAHIEPQLSALAARPNSGLIVLPDPFLGGDHHRLIIDAAAKHRLPAMYSQETWVERGGLICYTTDQVHIARRAAEYVSRILRGERPGDLPVQMPVKYRLVVNLRTAKALGARLPESVLVGADRVID